MNTTAALSDDEFTLTAPAATTPAWRRAAAALLLLAAGALAWQGGPLGILSVLMAAAGGVLALRRTAAEVADADDAAAGEAARSAHGPGGRHGAEVMVEQVVPVWSRQMEVTRDAANTGLADLLQVFSEMAGALHTLTDNLSDATLSAQPGAVDRAVRRESPALQALTDASERAFAQRDAAVAALAACAEGLSELQQLAKQAREIARHTRLVAFNASIEANRHTGGAEGGSQAVAVELRMLGGRMAESGERIERVVLGLNEQIRPARRSGEINDTSGEELRLEIDVKAREALAALFGSLGNAVQGSADVHRAATSLRDQVESAFMHFQFGDRISQMLSIVANDMSNFARWVAANPRATQSDAAEWLATLEGSYTMEEQRSHHHGNVHVERKTGVEFF